MSENEQSNTVEFSVFDDGEHVEVRWHQGQFDAVAIRPNWRRSLDRSGLESAVAQAWHRARERTQVAADLPRYFDRIEPAHQLSLTTENILCAMEEMNQLAAAIKAEVRRVAANPPKPTPPAMVQPHGANVTIVAAHGRIYGVQLNPDWAEDASTKAIGDNITRAIKLFLEDPEHAETAPAEHFTTPEMQRIRARLDELTAEAGMHRNKERQ